MSRVLAATVVLTGEGGQPIVLLAGTEVNDETAALITNPMVWADAEADGVEVEEPAAEVEPQVDDSAEDDQDEAPADDEGSEPQASQADVEDEAPADDEGSEPQASQADVEDEAPAKSKRSK